MSFDKDYPNRKDWRKQYTGARAIDRTCRAHGSCDWCSGNRLIKSRLLDVYSLSELLEYSIYPDSYYWDDVHLFP